EFDIALENDEACASIKTCKTFFASSFSFQSSSVALGDSINLSRFLIKSQQLFSQIVFLE
ncbi:hypothetical protein, partial [Exiguobacterium sp. s142]|uniref:hypothetical protein n=1 Tax=Exiguobacterium sp. s142 TaxID=2751222 RepID=UPI001BECD597